MGMRGKIAQNAAYLASWERQWGYRPVHFRQTLLRYARLMFALWREPSVTPSVVCLSALSSVCNVVASYPED